MATALRKFGVYLGLVEDEDAYDDYEPDGAGEPESPDHGPGTVTRLPAATRRPTDRQRISTIHPRAYNDAKPIGEWFRSGTPVIMNLTEMDDADAKRLVDFAAGLVFGLRGTIERVTAKVFLLSPENYVVGPEDRARIAEGGFFNQS